MELFQLLHVVQNNLLLILLLGEEIPIQGNLRQAAWVSFSETTEWLVMRHEDSINKSGEQLTLNGKPLKKVDQFCYLGAK